MSLFCNIGSGDKRCSLFYINISVMTYFIDSLETSFKYLAGFQQKTLGKLYPRTRLYMPKVVKKQARKTLENSCQQALSLKTLEQRK